MFRITRYMQFLAGSQTAKTPPVAIGSGPVVIWNLIRRCNLTCKHCYSVSADKEFAGELSTDEIFTVMDDLHNFGVRVLILSGGEPLLRPDIFDISTRAKQKGFYVGLSTNGTLIDADRAKQLAEVGYDYVGISIDGLRETHDRFRRKVGAFDQSMAAIRHCRSEGIKVGLRLTLTRENASELPQLLDLMDKEDIGKFYLSHLNYAGRGNKHRREDAHHLMTRDAMDRLFERCLEHIEKGTPKEFVTGNNDADAVYLLLWATHHFPGKTEALRERLTRWGGNSSGVNIANIDNLGHVHPDTMWWNHDLGSVRERPFSEIWPDTSDPLMAGLKSRPRPVKGRCGHCVYMSVCNGNTRVRAYQLSGDYWAEDPGCYLTDDEIGLPSPRSIMA